MTLPPIAIYCSSGSWGGLEMNTSRLAGWLSARGHPIHLFCLPGSPLYSSATPTIKVHPVSINHRFGDIRKARNFRKTLENHNIRILFLVDNRDLDFGSWVKRNGRSPFILIYQQHMMLGIPKKDLFHTWRFMAIDAWITLLPYMEREILSKTRFPASRIHRIPLGIDIESMIHPRIPKQQAREILNLPANGIFLGILGRIDPQKGQHIIIEALHQLQERYPDLNLLIMGEPTRGEGEKYLEDLHTLTKRYGLTSKVIFLGYRPDIQLFYSAIDLFILGSFGETYGMVTLEAMASRVPVIGTRSGGTTELLGNGQFGYLYTPKDPTDLANTIRLALDNSTMCAEKADQAFRHTVSTYTHIRELDDLESLILDLADKKGLI